MKYFCTRLGLFLSVFVIGQTIQAAPCDEKPVNGVYYTSSFCWNAAPPFNDVRLSGLGQPDDTKRLQRAISRSVGKLVFDEGNYFITSELSIDHSFLIIEGTGRSNAVPAPLVSQNLTSAPDPAPSASLYNGPDRSTKIVQRTSGKSIFKIAENIYAVSIRDMGLMGGPGTTGTVGILFLGGPGATGVPLDVPSSVGFQFSNLTFTDLGKGIYVNAQHFGPGPSPPTYPDLTGKWQADNVRLDHAWFVHCRIGVHINSNNSGWSMSSLDFNVPPDRAPREGDDDPTDYETWAIYMERSTYANMNLLIGNGEPARGNKPTGFIKILGHLNVTIQNATDEPHTFDKSLDVGVSGRLGNLDGAVNVSNSFFGNEVRIDNTTYVSTANQYGGKTGEQIPVNAYGASRVFSFGDKFCFERVPCAVNGVDYSNFKMNDTAKLISSSTQKGNYFGERTWVAAPYETGTPLFSVMATDYAPTLMRLGRTAYWFDFTRNESDGALEINGNQTCCNAVRIKVGARSQVQINTDGSVTYGSVTYGNLGTGAAPSAAVGTVVYCSNCTKATPCGSGGTGAIAKRVNSSSPIWDCD